MVGHKYKLNYKQEPSQYKNLLKNLEANIESMVCAQDFWKDKVNTTKYIKMVSITSIETKLVQKKPNTIAQVVALGSWKWTWFVTAPVIQVKNGSLGFCLV